MYVLLAFALGNLLDVLHVHAATPIQKCFSVTKIAMHFSTTFGTLLSLQIGRFLYLVVYCS